VVDFAKLLTDFSYTNFTVGLSNVDALDRLRVHLNIILFSTKLLDPVDAVNRQLVGGFADLSVS